MNLINIYDSNGNELNLSVLGLVGLKLAIPSPSYDVVTESAEGLDGEVVIAKTLKPRGLNAQFYTKATDYLDSLSVRDELYRILGNGAMFYVSESKQPSRRWKVYLDEWTPERFDIRVHVFSIPLTAPSGTSESINIVDRAFTTPTFSFKNEGSRIIDPRKHIETEIEFMGDSLHLAIMNKSTGDTWNWNGTTVLGDVVLLKGARSFKNGVSVFGQTNKKLITLNPDWNDFEVVGATGPFELTIRSRFYFL